MTTCSSCQQLKMHRKSFTYQIFDKQSAYDFNSLFMQRNRWSHNSLCIHTMSGRLKLKFLVQVQVCPYTSATVLEPQILKQPSASFLSLVTWLAILRRWTKFWTWLTQPTKSKGHIAHGCIVSPFPFYNKLKHRPWIKFMNLIQL